ncbi:YbaK/EbsC family protein [Candidatus Falkowbacteria bacterium]|nr:YbaK/EbsC family protein [Candidatus Falkowbacteria bacterium]
MKTKAIKIIESKGVTPRIIRLSNKGVSSNDVIKYAIDPLDPFEVCKTIIIKDKLGVFYGLLLKGGDKIDFVKVKDVIGQRAAMASHEEVLSLTGVEPGAICPVTLDMPIYIDEKVFGLERINFGSSDHAFGIEVLTDDLEKILAYVKVGISQ